MNRIAEKIIKKDDGCIGDYQINGYHVRVTTYGANGNQRFKKLYNHRRANGLCIACGKKVTKRNPTTGRLYRLCEEHREKIDRKNK